MNAPVTAVKVCELPKPSGEETNILDGETAMNQEPPLTTAKSSTSDNSAKKNDGAVDLVSQSDTSGDLLAASEPCCDELADLSTLALALLDNPVPESVTRDATAYLEWVKKHDAYMAGEEKLYQEREQLLASLLDMELENTTPADVEAWIAKMKDWEKRSEALELTAPEPFTTEYQH